MTAKRSKKHGKTLRLDYYDPQRVELPKSLMRQIKVRRLGRASSYTAWIVDGSVIRSEVDIDFAIGGNPARYSYVPENEIWLEDTGDEDDMKATFMHEVWEAGSMRAGASYNRAHGEASAKEKRVRAGGVLPVFMPNPSVAFHILGFDAAGKQVAHDMQSTQPAAEYAARRLLCDSLLVVRATVHPGTLDVYDPEPIFDHFAPMPTAWSAERSADANYYSFWISPEGDIYPVAPFNHIVVERALLRYQLVPASEETVRGYSPAIEAGWLQVSARDDDTVTFDFKREPKQRQLDAVFDLVQAHKAKPPVGGYRRRELFYRGALEWLGAPAVTRNPAAPFLTICSWCKGVIFDGPVGPAGEVSHGLCYPCAVEHAEEYGLTDEDLEEMREAQQGAKKNPGYPEDERDLYGPERPFMAGGCLDYAEVALDVLTAAGVRGVLAVVHLNKKYSTPNEPKPDHVLVRVGDQYMDAYGAHSKKELQEFWCKLWRVPPRDMVVKDTTSAKMRRWDFTTSPSMRRAAEKHFRVHVQKTS